MKNSGKLMSIVSIIFCILCLISLIVTIVELCQLDFNDVQVSVQEGGSFKDLEMVIRRLHLSYCFEILFWTALTIWHALSAIANWRN